MQIVTTVSGQTKTILDPMRDLILSFQTRVPTSNHSRQSNPPPQPTQLHSARNNIYASHAKSCLLASNEYPRLNRRRFLTQFLEIRHPAIRHNSNKMNESRFGPHKEHIYVMRLTFPPGSVLFSNLYSPQKYSTTWQALLLLLLLQGFPDGGTDSVIRD